MHCIQLSCLFFLQSEKIPQSFLDFRDFQHFGRPLWYVPQFFFVLISSRLDSVTYLRLDYHRSETVSSCCILSGGTIFWFIPLWENVYYHQLRRSFLGFSTIKHSFLLRASTSTAWGFIWSPLASLRLCSAFSSYLKWPFSFRIFLTFLVLPPTSVARLYLKA